MKVTDRPTVILLSAVVSAFVSGVTVLAFLDARIEAETKAVIQNHPLLKGPKGDAGPPGPSVAIGTVMAWPLDEIPDGWLACDGSNKPRSGKFAKLSEVFESAGFPYGDGDGSSTFTLPDYTGQLLRGAMTAEPAGSEGGTFTVAGHNTNLSKQHRHKVPETTGAILMGLEAIPRKYSVQDDQAGWTRNIGSNAHHLVVEGGDNDEGQHRHLHGGETEYAPGHSHSIDEIPFVPRYIAIRYIIKYK